MLADVAEGETRGPGPPGINSKCPRLGSPGSPGLIITHSTDSELPVTARTPQMNGLVLKIVDRADIPNRPTSRSHENGGGDGFFPSDFDSGQEGAVTDSGRAENGTLPLNKVIHTKDLS